MLSVAELEPLWELARRDAGYDNSSKTTLCIVPGDPGGGAAAIHLHPDSDACREPAWPLRRGQIAALNDVAVRGGHRVLVRDLATTRIALGRLRHELEHARQYDRSHATYKFMGHAQDVIRHAVQEATEWMEGSGPLYNLLPQEADANRSAAILTASEYGPPSEEELSARGSELFRDDSPVEPETLAHRLLALTALYPESLDEVARRATESPTALLESLEPGAAKEWARLSADSRIRESARQVLSLCPTRTEIEAAPEHHQAWLKAAECFDEALGTAYELLQA